MSIKDFIEKARGMGDFQAMQYELCVVIKCVIIDLYGNRWVRLYDDKAQFCVKDGENYYKVVFETDDLALVESHIGTLLDDIIKFHQKKSDTLLATFLK